MRTFRVVQSDCRTAWFVVDAAGRVVPHSMRRNWKVARDLAKYEEANANRLAQEAIDLKEAA